MKYLGIDYGSKWVGIAVSDADGKMAFPRTTLANDAKLPAEIEKIVRDERIQHIVVGDTRTLGGAANAITEEAEKFVAGIRERSVVPIDTMFEGWSSAEASRYAPKGETHDDASAAAIILQRFLDFSKKG